MELALRLLGTLEADVASRAVDLGGPRQRAVLALLLVARGEVVSVDRLIEDLWRGEPPPRATGALQAYVSNLRRVLEPDRAPRTPSAYLISAAPGYAVRVDEAAVDAWRFERLLREAIDLAPARAVERLEEALGLWRGDALAEFAQESWAAPEAARLDELRLVARERLVDARVRAGRPDEAVVDAERLVGDAPLREEGWRLLALGQYLTGRQGDALATLRRARQLLSDELGVDPGPALAALERDVLAQAVELAAPAAPAPAAAGPVALPAPEFVGRVAERRALLDAAAAARPGVPAVALVAGEVGGGKSALLARVRADLLDDGWRVTVGRCAEDDSRPPAWAWAQALRALAEGTDPGAHAEVLTPLLTDAPPRDTNATVVDRFRMHSAVRGWLATMTDRPLAVLLDDVHRADIETRALLTSLLDQGLPQRVLYVVAYRPENGEVLADLLATLARYEPTRVRLHGLDEAEIAALLAALTRTDPAPSLVRALAERTDGNPFFLKESVRLLLSEGELVATSQVPEGVADVLRRRLARLPEESVSVLRLAAVIGRDVDVALLIRAAEVDEDHVIDALETGLISDLLVEPGPGAVRFSHLVVRDTLYAGVPNLRRVRWHARVAEAVAELYPGDLTALAHHSARAATPATGMLAARRCIAAAELAESSFAFDTAAEHYDEARRCLELAPDHDSRSVVAVLTRRVPALIRAGATLDAARARREAVELAAPTGDPTLLVDAIISGTISGMRTNLASYGEMDSALVAIMERLLPSTRLDLRRRCLLTVTLLRETSAVDDARAERAYRDAVALARELDDDELLGLALVGGAEVFPPELRPAERSELCAELQQLVARSSLPVFEVVWHALEVSECAVRADLVGAREHIAAARETARRFQLRQGTFLATVLEAMICHMAGELDRSEELYLEAFGPQLTRGTVDAVGGYLLARTTVRYTEGRLPELVGELQRTSELIAPALHLYALALAEEGNLDAARQVLDTAPPIQPDYLQPVFLTLRALTVAACGAVELAPALYDALLPHAGRVAGVGSNGYVVAPVGRALGRLALLLGRPDDARRHFEQALALARACGSRPWSDQIAADLRLLPVE